MFKPILYRSRLRRSVTKKENLVKYFLANILLQSMDETVNPCENFYQFACGKWIRNTKIQDDGSFPC